MTSVYYERINEGHFELCQNVFKDNPDHILNVCATAINHTQLEYMYSVAYYGGVDWLDKKEN